jgi:hypothetical protein
MSKLAHTRYPAFWERERGREGLQPQAQPQAANCKQAPTEESEARKAHTGGNQKKAQGRRRQNTKARRSHSRKVHKKARALGFGVYSGIYHPALGSKHYLPMRGGVGGGGSHHAGG